MENRPAKYLFASLVALFLAASSTPAAAEIRTSFLYTLSDFTGSLPFGAAKLYVDKDSEEIYVITGESIQVFNKLGMEVYKFNDGGTLGAVRGVAVDGEGNILVLSYDGVVTRCNYRGEPLSRVDITGLPAEFSGLKPDAIAYRKGRLYLADRGRMQVVVTDGDGSFEKGFDIAALMDLEEKKRRETDIFGFDVDGEGNILITIATLFSAHVLSLDGDIAGFGMPGSKPGSFGIAVDIAADDRGNYFVADALKSVVMIFDKDFNFLTQFGYRGEKPENLVAPGDLAVHKGLVYVTQGRKRGVSVFRVYYN